MWMIKSKETKFFGAFKIDGEYGKIMGKQYKNLKDRDHLVDLGVDGRLSKQILKKQDGRL